MPDRVDPASPVDEEPDPRWSLANERTLLAYSRTALAFVVAGLAVAGSRRVAETSLVFASLGLPLLVLGGVVAWVGRRQYLSSQQAMRSGGPMEPPVAAVLLPMALVVIIGVALVVAVVEMLRP